MATDTATFTISAPNGGYMRNFVTLLQGRKTHILWGIEMVLPQSGTETATAGLLTSIYGYQQTAL